MMQGKQLCRRLSDEVVCLLGDFEFQSVELRLFDSTIRSTVVIQKVMVVHDIIQFLDRRVSMWRAWFALG